MIQSGSLAAPREAHGLPPGASLDPRPREWRGVVERIGPGGQAGWDAYVDTHPRGDLYHRWAWRTVAERAYGLRTPFLVARERAGGPISGVLPLFVVDSMIGRYLTSAMFGGYGSILADSEGARRALLAEACRVTGQEQARSLKLKAIFEAECPAGFTRFDLGAVATLSLEGGEDEVWKRLRGKARNCVRKAQKCGLELRVGPRELRHFYDVLAGNYHRKGTPIYGFPVMEELHAALGDDAEAVTLHKDGQVVSGALVLYDKSTVHVPFCSSRADAFHLNPNNLLYWEIMRRACARGMKTLDFGRSPLGSGAMAFKLHWGAVTTPQPYFVHTASGEPPPLDTDGAGVQRLIWLWQRMPRRVVDVLGPWVHGRFLV